MENTGMQTFSISFSAALERPTYFYKNMRYPQTAHDCQTITITRLDYPSPTMVKYGRGNGKVYLYIAPRAVQGCIAPRAIFIPSFQKHKAIKFVKNPAVVA